MAGLGIALKDFLVLSKLQEIAPGTKFNLACPYFSSEEVTCRIARVTRTKGAAISRQRSLASNP